MKRFVAALLVLTMIFALSTAAMASCKFAEGDWVVLKKDATAYTAAKSSKETKSVAEKGSMTQVVKVCGDYVKVKLSDFNDKTTYFKKSDLEHYTGKETPYVLIFWVKGGKGMSSCTDWIIDYYPEMTKVKVTGHTNLRKNPGMKCKSQGVVEKGDVLKYKGKLGYDDRGVGWYKICKSGKILWISHHFATMPYCKK